LCDRKGAFAMYGDMRNGDKCPGALARGRWRAPGRAAVRVAVPATCRALNRFGQPELV